MVKITKPLINKKTERIIEIVLVIFGLFLLIQIIKLIAGGSWTTEDIIIGLLIFNLGSIFTIGLLVAQLKSDHKHLKGQFRSLADDFKLHKKEE